MDTLEGVSQQVANLASQIGEHLTSITNLFRQPKLDFPRFDGSNPRAWKRKLERFFTIHPMNGLQKVAVAPSYLDGKAGAWFSHYEVVNPNATWDQLVADICSHFEDVNQGNYVGNFNKLTQSGSVDDYFTQFQELKSYMLTTNNDLSEEYFVSSFLSGLKDDIRSQVQMFRPKKLSDALSLARQQEGVVDLQHPKSKFPFSFHSTTSKTSTPTVSSTNFTYFTLAVNVILALSFIIVIAAILGASENEHPNKPIRVWLGVCIGFWVVVLFLSAILTGIRFATSSMVILLLAGIAWWVVGLFWIISGGKELMDDAPLLFWLTAVLLGMGAALGAALLFCVYVYSVWGLFPMKLFHD